MEKITFEKLPEAVTLILERLNQIETLLQTQKAQPEDEILNVKEAAAFLKITVSSLYTKIYHRTLPHYKFGKRLQFKKAELLAAIEATRIQTAKEEYNQ